ncbi:nucleolar and coiled-body phosphoprotein 1-like [Struthio camelus]|uniref:nucleolar and coiled-body phosphoprotein 1-like n=1 Tax=Struthio camelus TaxID=8801 RepID=UPI003603B8A3
MQRSRTPASSHQRDRLPSLPGPQSSWASERGIVAKVVEDTARDVPIVAQALHPSTSLVRKAPLGHRETLPGRTHARAGTPHLPGLPPLPTKAARQAHGGLETSAGETAGSTRRTKLPALKTSGRSSSRGRANAMDTKGVARRTLERETKGLEKLAVNSSTAAAREPFPPGSAAGKAVDSGKSLAEEELKPCPLSLPPLPKHKQEAHGPTRAMQELVHCLPEPRPGSCASALGKARLLLDDSTRTTLPLTSQQLSGSSSFVPGAQAIPEREMRSTPAYKERDELLSAPGDACAQEVKAHCSGTLVQRQDLVLSKSSVSQGAELQPRELQVPPAETRQGETASSAPHDALQCATTATGVSEEAGLPMPCCAEVSPGFEEDIPAISHSDMAPPSPSVPEPASLVQNVLGEAGLEMMAESQGPAPQGPAPPAGAVQGAGLGLESAALSRPDDRSPGPGRHPAQPDVNEATKELSAAVPKRTSSAQTSSLAVPASPGQDEPTEQDKSTAPAAQQGPDAPAGGGKREVSGAGAPASPGKGGARGTPRCPRAEQGPNQQPLGIICHVQGQPLRVHPDNTSQYLAVLSIKTEPLEELERSSLARTGHTLAQLREACFQRKKLSLKESEGEEAKGKRFSLTASGSLNVKRKELLARNSFYNLWKPEITRVELLKDARCKWEVLERLYAHAPRREREVGARKRVLGAAQEEQGDWSTEEEEEDADEELLQSEELEENTSLREIWVRPSLRSLLADKETCPQKVPCSPSVKAGDTAREAAGDMENMPPDPAVLGGAEAGACALGDGFQEAGDSVSLAPSERPETKPEAWPAARDPQKAEEKVPASAAEAVPEARRLAGGPCEENISLPLEAPLQEEGKAVASALCGGPPPQVASEPKEEKSSPIFRQAPEVDPGITTLPDAAAPRRRPSLLRTVLRALRRAFCCSCATGQ